MSTNTGSTHVFFNSTVLSIVAAIFMILVVIMYLKKEKVKSVTTNLFLITIGLNFLCILFEFLMPYGVKIILDGAGGNRTLGVLICKVYYCIAFIWDLAYLLYTCTNTYTHTLTQDLRGISGD
jgi:hypothetical protein